MGDDKTTKAEEKALNEAGVATPEQNASLEHSQGGTTTRDDATDLGVPMLQGDPSEPAGPEDALGEGDKRGDYRGRVGDTEHFQSVPVPADEQEEGGPTTRLEPQNPRAEQIGDEPGLKGGVDTDPAAA